MNTWPLTTRTFRLRMTEELHARLRSVAEAYGLSQAEVVRRALRRVRTCRRTGVVALPQTDPTTPRASVATFEAMPETLVFEMPPAELHQVIAWYLDQYPPEPDTFRPAEREGVDYLVAPVD